MKLSTVRDLFAIVRDVLLIAVLGAVLIFGVGVVQGINDLRNDPAPVSTEPAPVFPEPTLDAGYAEPSPGECIGNGPCTEVPND